MSRFIKFIVEFADLTPIFNAPMVTNAPPGLTNFSVRKIVLHSAMCIIAQGSVQPNIYFVN